MSYITNFKQAIKKANIKKAKKLLNEVEKETYETKLEIINELALAPDNMAIDLLFHLTKLKIRDKTIYDHIIQLVLDRAHLNFKFAIILYKTDGVKKIKGLIPLMRHILVRTTDPEIIEETMITAGQEKIRSLVDDIAEYIYYDSTKLKARAVKVLAEIDSDSAVQRLEQASTTTKCDKNILDALESLKAQRKYTDKQPYTKKKAATTSNREKFLSLNTKLKSQELDTRFKAFNDIGDIINNEHASMLAENLKSDNHDLKINTLRIIARTIQGRLVPDIYGLLDHKYVDPKIKFAIFETLSAFPELDSAAAAINGIENPAMYVRMAAANVLNKDVTDFVCAELKDRIESGRERGTMIARAIIDVKAENIIDRLMASDSFSYIASNYLCMQTAPISSLKKYIHILRKREFKSTAKKFEAILMDRTNNTGLSAMVISSSPSVLDVYEKLLLNKGYTAIIYKSCQDAFEVLSNIKPAFVLCDLFLNKMTGIDFAREVREFYSKEELPLIISSMQKDFTTDSLKKECKFAGINSILEFPATIPGIDSIL